MLCRLPHALVLAFGTFAVADVAWADGFELPARKAGCWKHTTSEGPFGKSLGDDGTFECVDAASEESRQQDGKQPADPCSQGRSQQSGKTLTWDASCLDGAQTVTIRIKATGDFQSKYATTFVSRRSGGGEANEVLKVVSHSKWLSATCPANLKPGRMLIFGGAGCRAD